MVERDDEKDILMSLASVSLADSSAEVFAVWDQCFWAGVDKNRADERVVRGANYIETAIGRLDLVSDFVRQLINDYLVVDPEFVLNELESLHGLLSDERFEAIYGKAWTEDVRSKVLARWEEGLDRCDKENYYVFVPKIMALVEKGLWASETGKIKAEKWVNEAADALKERTVVPERFHEVYRSQTEMDLLLKSQLETDGGNVDWDRFDNCAIIDNSHPIWSFHLWVDFCRWSMEHGFKEQTANLRRYLNRVMREADLKQTDPVVISELIRWTICSDLPANTKRTRVMACINQTRDLPEVFHGKSCVLAGAVEYFLAGNNWEDALSALKQMGYRHFAEETLSKMMVYALEHDRMGELTAYRRQFEKKHSGLTKKWELRYANAVGEVLKKSLVKKVNSIDLDLTDLVSMGNLDLTLVTKYLQSGGSIDGSVLSALEKRLGAEARIFNQGKVLSVVVGRQFLRDLLVYRIAMERGADVN